MAKPKFDKRTYMKIKGIKDPAEMFRFLDELYKIGFEDGANADVNPSIRYMALKKGVKYECGCCGAELFLEDEVEK